MLDFVNLLFLPLMALTAASLWKERGSLWDDKLTERDRYLLQRMVIFLLLPAVVFLHECGHALAVLSFGGIIKKFHFAFVWGYVVPEGHFTPVQELIIYLSGNLVQVLLGILCFAAAFLLRSPPVVACMVYLGFWSLGGTLIIYTLMSFTGLYGDWAVIYSEPLPRLIHPLAAMHGILVAALLYGLYGTTPRVWFAGKTLPNWAQEREELEQAALQHPSASTWISLAQCYYRTGLYRKSREYLENARALNPELPDVLMLSGALCFQSGKFAEAACLFERIIANPELSPVLGAKAMLALSECLIRQGKPLEALSACYSAIDTAPHLGDPRCLSAILLSKMGKVEEAHNQLLACQGNMEWLDPSLQKTAERQLGRIVRKLQGSQ